jgi:hypothetical protein
MKFALLCLVIFTTFFNFSCRQNVESSPVAANEQPVETPSPAPTPDKYEEFDIIEQFSRMQAGNEPAALKYKGYKIEPVTVKKKYDKDSPVADIYDAVLSKNGKRITRFEGVYYPLGNFMSFGLYQFLSGSEKQLFIIEESNRYDHAWIVNLEPKFKVLFDAADYDVLYGYLRVIDIENDGQKEITLSKNCNLGFIFSNVNEPWVKVIFKYDAKARKYLPASHLFEEFTLDGIDAKFQEFNDGKNNSVSELLKIFMTYVYAGKEDEAWKFFDKEIVDSFEYETVSGKVKGKERIREYMKKELNEDPIYKFIRNDLGRRK